MTQTVQVELLGGNLAEQIDSLKMGLMLNTFDDLVDHGRTLVSSPVVIADEFEDSAGIDAANSTGETYNAAGYVSNAGGYSADQVPTMTSNTSPGGTLSRSGGTSNGDVWHVFNDVLGGTYFVATGATGWIQYQFTSAKTISAYTLTGFVGDVDRNIKSWTLSGSNDGVSFDVLDTVTNNLLTNATETFVCDTTGSYTYYRLTVTANNGNGSYYQLVEMEMFETVTPAALDVRSVGVTMNGAPTSGFFVGKFSQSDPDTVYASSDGGVTWDTVTLTDYGDFATGVSLFAGPVTLTGGGTDVRLRATKASGAECRVEAWSGVFG